MKKVLIGCGIVAALAIIAVVVGSVFLVNTLKDSVPDTDRLLAMEEQMVETYGDPEDFMPPLDGVYDPQRVAHFVSLREELIDAAGELRFGIDEMTETVREGTERGGIIGKFKAASAGLRGGMGLMRETFEYIVVADSMLLEQDMGKGEYLHYNLMVLYDGIPDDIHAILAEKDDEESFGLGIAREFSEGSRSILVRQMENARRAVGALDSPTAAQTAWRERLYDEISKTQEDEHYWPFRGDLPPSLREALAPHEVRIAMTIPRDVTGLLVESPLTMEVDADNGGLQVQIDR